MTVSTMASPPSTLLQAFFPALRLTAARSILLVIAASLALTISAKMQIALGPVPFTMQTYVVLVLAALLGARMAASAVLLYLAEGLLGLPVFAAGGGWAYLFSPTFGYLVGFVPAALLVGHATERGYGRTWKSSLILMALAHALLFVFGLLWLTPALGFSQSYWVGLHPFWLVSLAKTGLATATVALAWKKGR